ncbi:hypothetical protein N9W23_01430 [Paracoccaceae bacterium]|nr:hypothetical protein [Paracoccaceae bacterium]
MKIDIENSFQYFSYLFLFYLISHGGLLLVPNAIFWDDWALFPLDKDHTTEIFKQLGRFFNIDTYVHISLLSIGPWTYKALTFILMFGSGIALDKILAKHDFITSGTRFLIVLFFLIMPFYWGRVALICMPYTISYFLFFLAWAIIDRYRVFSLFLFFLSFNTNSLLVFYALPILDCYIRMKKKEKISQSFLIACAKKIDFLLLPFVFFAIKVTFFQPSGDYQGYNEQYNLINLFKAPIKMFMDWSSLKLPIIFTLILALIINTFMRKLLNGLGALSRGGSFYLFYSGILSFAIAGFPYWILGHVPTFSEWTSRHQLLFPLGLALIIVSILVSVPNRTRLNYIIIAISLCGATNVFTYKDFYFDWQKQKKLIYYLKRNDLVLDADLIVFDDRANSLNAINRTIRFYEWNGILKYTFGDESRHGLNLDQLYDYSDKKNNKWPHKNQLSRPKGYTLSKNPEAVLIIIRPKNFANYLFGKGPLIEVEASKLSNVVIDL